jgi:hypothetical protein
MAKLSLKIDPTFPATVSIPKAGSEPVQLKLTCKHRTKDELQEFIKTRSEKSDVDSILAMASGWDLEDAFDTENIEALCQKYIAAPLEIYKAYVSALVGERAKN